MSNKDWVRSAITTHLKPELEAHGFYRYKPKEFVRLRGYLLDVITFQMSQYGSKLFYVHHFTNLVCSPDTEKITCSYRIGSRIDYSEYDDVSWIGDTEENAVRAVRSLIQVIQKDVYSWFDELSTMEAYTIRLAGHYQTQFDDIDFLIALILCGEIGKPYEVIKEVVESDGEHYCREGFDMIWESIKSPFGDDLTKARSKIDEITVVNLEALKLTKLAR